MQYSDGYKENTYLTWKGEKYRVTSEFESLSFYKLKKDKNVTTDVLLKICKGFNCDIYEIMECID